MRARICLAFSAMVAFVVLALLMLPAGAAASFHLMRISEVHPGTAINPDGAFVELQMVAANQNHIAGHEIVVYDAGGNPTTTVPIPADVTNGENNATILLGDISVTNADVDANIGTFVIPAGGAVCFPDGSPPDCVAWGNFTGGASLPGETGTPAAPGGIPDGSSLSRSKAPGCATLLEPSDDTDQSAADFTLTAPTPRPNSVAPTETPCAGGGAPKTTIDKGPKKKTSKKTAKFKFSSDEAGASFECRLDGDKWTSCNSPQKYKRLKPGKHLFEVRASIGGRTDKSPAAFRWKRKPKKP